MGARTLVSSLVLYPPYLCSRCLSQLSSSALAKIKACPGLIKVIKSLKESNLEFLLVDSHTLVTDHPDAAVRAWCLGPWGGRGVGELVLLDSHTLVTDHPDAAVRPLVWCPGGAGVGEGWERLRCWTAARW